MTEIVFGQITVQMVLAAMLVDALHPALEDRKEAFNGVRRRFAANVFLFAVIDGQMLTEV